MTEDSYVLGLDTSNYTTSISCYYPLNNHIDHVKRLLPVKKGTLGLRQSDALFHHIKAIGSIVEELSPKGELLAVSVSNRPRDIEESYMPCFLAGTAVGKSIAAVNGVPYMENSHQCGHIIAALFSAGRLDLIDREFIAFHVSGGTTEVLKVTPNKDKIIECSIISATADISCGMLIDRVGVKLGLDFPAGPALEKLAVNGNLIKPYPVKLKNGNCNLSGIENIVDRLIGKGYTHEDISLYTLNHVARTLSSMAKYATNKYGDLPILFSGGVMSNNYIKEFLRSNMHCIFATPALSSDNAVGTSILGSIKMDRGLI